MRFTQCIVPLTSKLTTSGKDHKKLIKESNKQDIIYRNSMLYEKADIYKSGWDKNGIIQFKSDHVAILQRRWGEQIQFIVAFDELTGEGYELRAIDEGKSGGDAGFSGGMNAYFYFQRMKNLI